MRHLSVYVFISLLLKQKEKKNLQEDLISKPFQSLGL